MTAQPPSVLKGYFSAGDRPSQQNYVDLIDSFVPVTGGGNTTVSGSLLVTGSAAVSGPVEFFSTLTVHNNVSVSGNVSLDGGNIALTGATGNASFSGTVNASALSLTGNLDIGGTFSAATIQSNFINSTSINANSIAANTFNNIAATTGAFSSSVSALSLHVQNVVSAASLNVTGNVSAAAGSVYASAMRSSFSFNAVAIISAAGTTQGAAALCSAAICRLQGVANGTTTGFGLMANRIGLHQFLYSDAVSANLWPPTGGTINALAANAAFPLAVSTMYTVVHLTASAYAVG